MKIAVVGAGAVGGYFGGRLAAAGHEVAFVARGATLQALRSRGLSIASPKGDLVLEQVHAAHRTDDVGPVDAVLFTVKLYDAEAAAATLSPLLGPDTVVITLQNGVEAVDLAARHVGRRHLAGGAAYIVAVAAEPGRILHTAADSLVIGETDGAISPRLSAFAEAGRAAGFRVTVTPTIELDLWTKFVRLSTWSGMTAVTRCPIGIVRDDPELAATMAAALEEAIAVARARGMALPAGLVEETVELVARFPHDSRSSMLDDLERGRPLELPWLSGAVVRMGRELGVPTPVHGFIAAVLGPFVTGARP